MLAILAQNGHTIGLFERLRIHQYSGEVHWIRPVRSPYTDWLSPHARLAEEFYSNGPTSSRIHVLGASNLILDGNGNILENIHTSTFTRLPYVVSFWEDGEYTPVYTLYPDTSLLWNRTVNSSITLPWRRLPSIPSRYFRQQNSPQPRRPIETDSRCAITLAPLTAESAYWLPCGHAFSDAIFQAAAVDLRCPLCRSTYDMSEITSQP